MITEIVTSFDPDTKRIARVYFTQDHVGAVIQAHLEVESSMMHVLKFIAKLRKDTRTIPKMFGPKILRLREFGIPEIRLQPLERLNYIRKKFAHDGQFELSDDDIKLLEIVTVEMFDGRKFEDFTVRLFERSRGRSTVLQYRSMSLIQKLGFLSSVIAMGLASTVEEINHKLVLSALGFSNMANR